MQAAIMWPLLSLFQLLTVFPAYHFNEHPKSHRTSHSRFGNRFPGKKGLVEWAFGRAARTTLGILRVSEFKPQLHSQYQPPANVHPWEAAGDRLSTRVLDTHMQDPD